MDICGTCKRALRGDDKHTILRLRGTVHGVVTKYVRSLGKEHELEFCGQYFVCSECYEVARKSSAFEVNSQMAKRGCATRVSEEQISQYWTM